ncbi:hypothetical protein EHE22_00875 [Ochrobactrum pseudogrignonense]|uniref:Uncharacterized protein n=1 Tax=Brucella pseudogrignonensis TaxID=419475 RepID=A0A7Y3WU76_9HYPH|nr:hypothetical protein [Brucella pseudogrignonensis]
MRFSPATLTSPRVSVPLSTSLRQNSDSERIPKSVKRFSEKMRVKVRNWSASGQPCVRECRL